MIVTKPQALPIRAHSWKEVISLSENSLIDPTFIVGTHDDYYEVKGLIPGGADIDAKVVGHTLEITGVTRQQFLAGKSFGYLRERPVRAQFTLPPDAAEEGVTSKVRHGLLVIRIPRTPCVSVDAECVNS